MVTGYGSDTDTDALNPDGTFNWHTVSRNYDSVLNWLLPHIFGSIKPQAKANQLMDEVSEKSDGCQRVDIQMTVNGITVNGVKLILDLWEAMQSEVEKRVVAKATEALDFVGAQRIFEETMTQARISLIEKFQEAGIAVKDYDPYGDY